MQPYDLLMVLVLAAATIFGFWKGLAWQIASLASFVVSYFAALRFSGQLAPTFGNNAPLNRFIAMAVIYVVTSFVIWMAFRLISGIIDKVRLEAFDKQLGALIGFAKGVLICVAITFFAVAFLPPNQGQQIVNSQSGHYIVAFLNKADAVVPPELHQVIDPLLRPVQQQLDPNFHGSGGGWPANTASATQPQSQSTWSLPKINWPGSGSTPANTQQAPGWPSSQPNTAWPQQPAPQQAPQQPAWPTTQTQSAPTQYTPNDPYGVPREPNRFPDPSYQAERSDSAVR